MSFGQIRISDFSGGLNTRSSVTSLNINEARDLQNINILPSGGFEKRRGNSAFNSSAMDSGAAVHGLGYFRTAAGVEYMMAIAGTKIFKADNLDGTMDDITGAVVITAGADNIWTHSVINNLSVFVGGAPDAPIKWNATGNAAALGGTPPSGSFGFAANNRMFIGSTSANPSRIYWSALGLPEDWTGVGSGSQDVGLNDGDTLVGGAILGIQSALLFKQNSIHLLNIQTAPFPLFPLFRDIGAVSKRGIVVVDGIVYFMTPEPRMKATDGTRIIDFPDTIDNTLDNLSKSRLKYIHGIHHRRLNQIWWFVSTASATSHDLCLVWDLKRKCWLRHTSGYKMNCASTVSDRLSYCGGYNGVIYKQDDSSSVNDASETAPGTISAFWRSGWMDLGEMLNSKTVQLSKLCYTVSSNGSFIYGFGYDFNPDSSLNTLSYTSSIFILGTSILGTGTLGDSTEQIKLVHMNGSGSFFQFLLKNANESERFSFNRLVAQERIEEIRR